MIFYPRDAMLPRVIGTATCLSARLSRAGIVSHKIFPLTPRSMTLNDLKLHKFEFLVNFAGFRRLQTQQQLNE